MENPAGVRAEFYNAENTETGESVLLTIVKNPQAIHQSYPNRMHGGVISALLDESIGRAVQIKNPEIWAVTIELSIKFRKPVPLDRPLYIESRITEIGPRAFSGEGKLFTRDGTILATAIGKFFRVSYDAAFGEVELDEKNWYLVPENLPFAVDIG